MTIHGDTRVDNYYWMRLSDEQKSAQTYDEHTQEVVNYINLENEYTQGSLNKENQVWTFFYQKVGFWGPGLVPEGPERDLMQFAGSFASAARTATPFVPNMLFLETSQKQF